MEEEEKAGNWGEGKRKLYEMVGSFLNILHNFQDFYEVQSEGNMDWAGKEQRRRKVVKQCYDLNAKYIQKQLDAMKKKVSGANLGLYSAVESQVQSILAKYLI